MTTATWPLGPSGEPQKAVIEGVRERKRADSRAATVEAAFRLFDERGYDEVTVADICAAADIGRRTFFRYFETKEALLAEPTQRMTERVAASIAAAPPGTTDAQVLRTAITESARYALGHRSQLGVYLRIAHTSSTLKVAPFRQLPEHEKGLAASLHARHDGADVPDWRIRLLVSRAVAVLRVWLDETLQVSETVDTGPLLDEMFDLDPWFARGN